MPKLNKTYLSQFILSTINVDINRDINDQTMGSQIRKMYLSTIAERTSANSDMIVVSCKRLRIRSQVLDIGRILAGTHNIACGGPPILVPSTMGDFLPLALAT